MKWLAILFALFGTIASFGIGSSVQSNSVAMSIQSSFCNCSIYGDILCCGWINYYVDTPSTYLIALILLSKVIVSETKDFKIKQQNGDLP